MRKELMLGLNDVSLMIIEERGRKDIVVGVPHHAPAGTKFLRCPKRRPADENAGYLGRYLAETLGCCSVVACNYFVDANKSLQTDYSVQIAAWNPRVLVEIHGHGGTNARHKIEISSGTSENDRFSIALADGLRERLSESRAKGLRQLSVCGEFAELGLQASETLTVTCGRWLAYHIELPRELRIRPKGLGKPPKIGYRFCDNLAQAIHGTDVISQP